MARPADLLLGPRVYVQVAIRWNYLIIASSGCRRLRPAKWKRARAAACQRRRQAADGRAEAEADARDFPLDIWPAQGPGRPDGADFQFNLIAICRRQFCSQFCFMYSLCLPPHIPPAPCSTRRPAGHLSARLPAATNFKGKFSLYETRKVAPPFVANRSCSGGARGQVAGPVCNKIAQLTLKTRN